MAKAGRKGKYETLVEPRLNEITEWCKSMNEKQVAEKLGISYSALNNYKHDHEELKDAILKGRKDLVLDLRSALIRRAKGFYYEEVTTTTTRVNWSEDLYSLLMDAGLSDEQIEQAKLVKTEVKRRYAVPDVTAINLALKNYDKDNWANDPQAMELRKKELELQEKRIDGQEW